MAGTLVSSVTDANLQMAFRSQYVTESLNEKLNAMPRGVVRGYKPVPGAGVDQVDLVVDNNQGDSVMVAVGSANTEIYALTYRESTTKTLDFSSLNDVGGVRYYIAFVPNYAAGVTTDGEWRAYDETEFENGDVDTDGGVFLFAIELPDVDAIPLITDILVAGQSDTSLVPFMREDQQDWVKDEGSTRRRRVMNWVPQPLDASDDASFAAGCTWDDVDFILGGGSIALPTAVGAYVLPDRLEEQFPVWSVSDESSRAKIIVQYWYKTDGSYAGGFELNLQFLDEFGNAVTTAKDEGTAGRCPTYRLVPTPGPSSGWEIIRYECHVPDSSDHGGTRSVAARMTAGVGVITAGDLRIGGLQVWIENESSVQVGYHDYAGESSRIPVINKMFLHGSPWTNPGADAEYWKLRAGTSDLLWEPHPAAAVATRRITWGTLAYAGPVEYEFIGDDTDNSFLKATDAHIETDRYVKSDALRSVATGSSAEVTLRDGAGANQCSLNAGRFRATEATPLGANVPEQYAIYGGNIIHAWGLITTDGMGGATLVRGYGIASVTVPGNDIRVTLHNAFTNADYCVISNGLVRYTYALNQAAGLFDVEQLDDAGAATNASTSATQIWVVAIGDQP